MLSLTAVTVAGCASSSAGTQLPTGKPLPFVLRGVEHVREVAQITGPASPNKTLRFDIGGQDLGSMFRADGKTWFVFGDTFGKRPAGMTGGGGSDWRSNTIAWSTDTNPADGIKLGGYVADDVGWAKELLPAKQVDNVEITVIPTYGFAANGAMYLTYMSVKHWGAPGEWTANYGGLAKSTDHGKTWTKLASPRWPGDSNFIQTSVAQVGKDLYFWCVGAGRFGGVQLMKVPERDVERKSAYRYFTGLIGDGKPKWSPRMKAAKTIVEDTVGELSVVWNTYLDRWLMTYTNGGTTDASIREAPAPWGPWSDAKTLVTQKRVPGLYAPFMSSQYTANHGRTVYFTLSKWGPYNVFWYRADLVKAG